MKGEKRCRLTSGENLFELENDDLGSIVSFLSLLSSPPTRRDEKDARSTRTDERRKVQVQVSPRRRTVNKSKQNERRKKNLLPIKSNRIESNFVGSRLSSLRTFVDWKEFQEELVGKENCSLDTDERRSSDGFERRVSIFSSQ